MYTAGGAFVLHREASLGTLEPGKLADLIVLDRDPLANIRNTNSVAMVMINGRLYDASTLDELYPRQRKLPVQQWTYALPSAEAGMH
jgi:cytosine/adenosine deaminase-related metal-dependent hydrolase